MGNSSPSLGRRSWGHLNTFFGGPSSNENIFHLWAAKRCNQLTILEEKRLVILLIKNRELNFMDEAIQNNNNNNNKIKNFMDEVTNKLES